MTAPIPPNFATVENVTHNDDGSVTVFARDRENNPFVRTYQPGEQITYIRRPKPTDQPLSPKQADDMFRRITNPTREERFQMAYRAIAGEFPGPIQSAIAAILATRLVELEDEN